MQTQIHKVTFSGAYSNGNNGVYPYKSFTANVPIEVVTKANVLGWFKKELTNTKSETYIAFKKLYPDFEVITTYAINDIAEVEALRVK